MKAEEQNEKQSVEVHQPSLGGEFRVKVRSHESKEKKPDEEKAHEESPHLFSYLFLFVIPNS